MQIGKPLRFIPRRPWEIKGYSPHGRHQRPFPAAPRAYRRPGRGCCNGLAERRAREWLPPRALPLCQPWRPVHVYGIRQRGLPALMAGECFPDAQLRKRALARAAGTSATPQARAATCAYGGVGVTRGGNIQPHATQAG